jgi:hypothetical protein
MKSYSSFNTLCDSRGLTCSQLVNYDTSVCSSMNSGIKHTIATTATNAHQTWFRPDEQSACRPTTECPVSRLPHGGLALRKFGQSAENPRTVR